MTNSIQSPIAQAAANRFPPLHTIWGTAEKITKSSAIPAIFTALQKKHPLEASAISLAALLAAQTNAQ